MRVIGVDFETYYDNEYSLSRMTTEAYIRDPRFEIIGVSIKSALKPDSLWFSGTHAEVVSFLDQHINWSEDAVLCHNTAFDGAIMSWVLDRKPKLWLDTMSMARPKHLKTIGVSLATLAKHYKLGEKGTAVVDAKGKRRADFTPAQMKAYGRYCNNDIDLTYSLFKILAKDTTPLETQCIDLTIRMFTEPKFKLNQSVLQDYLKEVVDAKEALIAAANQENRDAFMSNDKFAELLIAEGVDPPMKWSAKQAKMVYAFAKTDKGMKDLLSHDSPRVQALAACRLGVKTTIEETRAQRFIDIAKRGLFPIMLNYWGAGTGRFSGGDKVNPQNLKRGGKLRQAMEVAAGYTVIASDLSQIEARVLALVTGQSDLVELFATKGDPYCAFATEVYGRTITKADPTERFLGKTCLAAGSQVLTSRGWCAIEDVRLEDKLWDGEEWVCHSGVVYNGMKKTLKLSGVSLTPDHLVLCGTQWKEANCVLNNASIHSLALDTGAESLRSWGTWLHNTAGFPPSLYPVPVTVKSTPSTTKTLNSLSQRAVQYALKKLQPKSATGSTPKPWLTTPTEQDYSTGYRPQSVGATQRGARHILPTEAEVSRSMKNGAKTDRLFSSMFKRLRGGMTRALTWIGRTTTKATSPTTLDLLQNLRTRLTNVKLMSYKQKSPNLKPVYDIANAGPRNKFTVKASNGALVVHNCILGLGYYTGASKLRETLRIGNGGVPVILSQEEADRIVKIYRKKNNKIAEFWRTCGRALDHMVIGGSGYISQEFNIRYEGETVILPNGAELYYPGLQQHKTEAGDTELRYFVRGKPTKIYSGLLCENIIQALARGVIVEYLVTVGDKYGVAHQCHDEIISVVLTSKVTEAMAFIEKVMSTPVAWLPGLPVACEVKSGPNYGAAH